MQIAYLAGWVTLDWAYLVLDGSVVPLVAPGSQNGSRVDIFVNRGRGRWHTYRAGDVRSRQSIGHTWLKIKYCLASSISRNSGCYGREPL